MQAANAILEGQKPITSEIFTVCPVLAAYHICSLDTAGTALFIFNDRDQFLSYNFVEKIERYSKGILDPIKIQARTLLHKSDLHLVPGGIPLVSLASDPGRLAEQHGGFGGSQKRCDVRTTNSDPNHLATYPRILLPAPPRNHETPKLHSNELGASRCLYHTVNLAPASN